MVYQVVQEARLGNSPITVISEDTDVLVILLHHVYAGTGNISSDIKVRMESFSRGRAVVGINNTVKQYGNVGLIPNLLAADAITDCDTISAISSAG